MFKVKKENGVLVLNDLGSHGDRNPATFRCIQEADKIYKWNDFREILIYTGDSVNNNNAYTYSKWDCFYKLVPDYMFDSWAEVGIRDYNEVVNAIDKA